LTSRDVTGWGFPYETWPQDLKDEYAYNPQLARQLLVDAVTHGFSTSIVVSQRRHEITGNCKIVFCRVGIDLEIKPLELRPSSVMY